LIAGSKTQFKIREELLQRWKRCATQNRALGKGPKNFGCAGVRRTHPFAENAKGWGILFRGDAG
jgi:hypothetical protein